MKELLVESRMTDKPEGTAADQLRASQGWPETACRQNPGTKPDSSAIRREKLP